MLIYKVTNLNNNKVYIGQTIRSLDYRKSRHLRACITKNYYDNYFHNALNKYGFDSWKWEVICECQNIKELNENEIYYISLYDSTNKV